QVPGRRSHVKNRPDFNPTGPSTLWEYEDLMVQHVQSTNTLFVRVLIGKVENLEMSSRNRSEHLIVQNDPGWRCRS
ncbi:uncharacterized protein A1O5_09586, partial [Cladophialophora psammophila CBS 110553]